MKRHFSLATAGLSLSMLLCGCISTKETVYRETARLNVEFENDAAARMFHEAYNKSPESRQRAGKRVSLHIPVVFSHSRTEVESADAGFNAAVRRCDTNGDGRITEQEARIYAALPAGSK